MRILYSHRIQSHDGQSVHVEEMVAALRSAGHEVRVVGPGFYAQAGFGGESARVAALRRLLPGMLSELAELAYNIPAYLRLRRACREFRPELIYERYNLYYLAGAWLARRTRLPFFVEVNAPLAEERARYGALALRRLARAAERRVWRRADRVLAVTGVLAGMVRAAGVDAARVCVTQNGIVPGRFAATEPSSAGDAAGDAVNLGFVGFVREWHGLDAVIDALARHRASGDGPSLRLVVIGDGPARAALERQVADAGLGADIRFTGLVAHAEIPRLVAGFDIALQPRSVAYASPLKIFEYMAAARAIVAPDQPNLREIIEHGRTGLLFDPAIPGAQWDTVMQLARDPALRAQLGAAARADVLRRDLTWAGNVRRVVAWAEAERGRRAG